jgi:purine-binding chemotaxis protein CheW
MSNKELTLEDIRGQSLNYKEEAARGAKIQLIIFKLGGEEYALNIDQIKEVVLTPGIAKIPHTPKYIKGVANIRGNIIAIVDLEEKFEINDEVKQNDKNSYTLVVANEELKIGILATEVPNTLTVYESDVDTSSTVIQFSNLKEDFIKGIIKARDRMIILVDIIKLMDTDELLKISNIK